MLLTVIVTSLLVRRLLKSKKGEAVRNSLEAFLTRIKCTSCMGYLIKNPINVSELTIK